MTWAEFQLWAEEHHGIKTRPAGQMGAAYRAAWAQPGVPLDYTRNGIGTGNHAEYGPREQRRVAAWAKIHHLVDRYRLTRWLLLAGEHATGYVFDHGAGPRWVASFAPVKEAYLAGQAVIVLRCGE